MSAEVSNRRGTDAEGSGGSGQNKIKVLIVDDQASVRSSVGRLLRLETDISVVGEAENGLVAVEQARKCQPNVILMDLAMPVMNGIEATIQILKLFPEIHVLVLSSHGEDVQIEKSYAAGVSGFVLKQTDVHCIVEAIRLVHRGQTWFSPAIAQRYRELCEQRARKKTSSEKGR